MPAVVEGPEVEIHAHSRTRSRRFKACVRARSSQLGRLSRPALCLMQGQGAGAFPEGVNHGEGVEQGRDWVDPAVPRISARTSLPRQGAD